MKYSLRYFRDKWDTRQIYKLDHNAVYFHNVDSWIKSSYTPNEFLYMSKQFTDGWLDLKSILFIEITEAEAFIEIL